MQGRTFQEMPCKRWMREWRLLESVQVKHGPQTCSPGIFNSNRLRARTVIDMLIYYLLAFGPNPPLIGGLWPEFPRWLIPSWQ